jgi:hypothetical protein
MEQRSGKQQTQRKQVRYMKAQMKLDSYKKKQWRPPSKKTRNEEKT